MVQGVDGEEVELRDEYEESGGRAEEDGKAGEDEGVVRSRGERDGGEKMEKKEVMKDERVVKSLVDPRKPSDREVEEHNRTHSPYRNWCEVCVRAKGKDADHRKCVQEDRGLSEYSFDYCFLGDELGCK